MAPDEPDRPDDAPVERADEAGAADGDAPAARSASDLRAKDLIGRTREELEQELDPATMAELASWFSRPDAMEVRARQVPDEVRAGVDQHDLDDFDRLAQQLGFVDEDRSTTLAAALAAVQPAMLELFDRHERNAARILPARAELATHVDETIVPAEVRALLVEEGEALPGLEPRHTEIPRDIEALLERDNAPQAVLRDLARPVEEFELRLEPAFPPPPAEEDLTHAIRDALRWRPEKVPPREAVPDVRAAWADFHRQPWPELIAAAKAIRAAEAEEADRQLQADAEAGRLWRF